MTDTSTQVVVQIVQNDNGDIVFQSKPTSRRRAEKIEDGMSINLDWEHFTTRIVSAFKAEGPSTINA